MQSKRELIDTLWNVNIISFGSGITAVFELIDTLWNVNTQEKPVLEEPKGINRYIMECKFEQPLQRSGLITELIDTLWNVNEKSIENLSSEESN